MMRTRLQDAGTARLSLAAIAIAVVTGSVTKPALAGLAPGTNHSHVSGRAYRAAARSGYYGSATTALSPRRTASTQHLRPAYRPGTYATQYAAGQSRTTQAQAGQVLAGRYTARPISRTMYETQGNLQPSVIVPTAGFRFRSSSTRTRSNAPRGLGEADVRTTVEQVDLAIARSKKRFLTVGVHTPWQIFHGTLALRTEFLVRVGNELVPAIDWMSSGVQHDLLPLVEKTPHGGRMHAYTVPYAFEGHTNQFLAILSLSGLPRTHQFRTPLGEVVTMEDMVRGAQAELNGEGELTWTLWFLSHYVEPDAEWLNAEGEPWSMERLVKIESRKSVEEAPCGGTHRLFALALARNAYLAKHGQLRGAWIEADQRVARYVAASKSMQNPDGTFSEKWYKARGQSADLERRLKTSGHQLEWLMAAVPQTDLSSHWMQSAVRAVAADVSRSAEMSAECGALYHALDALVLYRIRMAATIPVEKPKTPESAPELQQAEAPSAGRTAKADVIEEPASGWKSSDETRTAEAPESISSTEPTEYADTADVVAEVEPALTAQEAKVAVADSSEAQVLVGPQQQIVDAMPLETRLPATVDDEAAPKSATNVFRTVSDPTPAPEVEAPAEADSIDEPAESADADSTDDGLKSTAPPSLQPPAKPVEARKAEILEASFRFTNLDETGGFIQ